MTSTDAWIEAGKVLALDPKANVECPDCGEADLSVVETEADEEHIERHMRCSKCGAYNALLKKRDP